MNEDVMGSQEEKDYLMQTQEIWIEESEDSQDVPEELCNPCLELLQEKEKKRRKLQSVFDWTLSLTCDWCNFGKECGDCDGVCPCICHMGEEKEEKKENP